MSVAALVQLVKVLDFGLVKSFVEGQELEGRAITKQGMLMGSPPASEASTRHSGTLMPCARTTSWNSAEISWLACASSAAR